MAFNLTWKYSRLEKNECEGNEDDEDMCDEEREHMIRVEYSDGSSVLVEDEELEAYGSEGIWRVINN